MLAAILAGLTSALPGAALGDPVDLAATADPSLAAGVEPAPTLSATAGIALAQILAATVAPALGELPLSEEDLALIDAITADPVPTTTVPPAAPFTTLRLGRERLRSVIPRTLGEALLAAPSALAVRRRHVSGDDLLLRGRAGARPVIRLDGLSLDHALTRFDDRPELGLLDPWLLEQVEIADRDRVDLTSLRPQGGLHTFAGALIRSPDRSTGLTAIADGTAGPVGVLLAGRLDDFGPLSTDTELRASQHAGLHARARILGRPGDPLDVTVGADLDRLILDEDEEPEVEGLVPDPLRREERLRRAASIDARLYVGALAASLIAGVRDDTVERDASAVFTREDALTVEARAQVAYRLGLFTLGLGGVLWSSRGTLEGARTSAGHSRTVEGSLDLGFRLDDRVEVEAHLGLVDARTEVDEVPIGAREAVTDGRVIVRPARPLALLAAWRYDLRLPTLADVVLFGSSTNRPERSLLVEAGPTLALGDWEAGLVGYARWLDRALEPVLGGATYVEDVLMGGAEGRLAWRPLPELTLSAAAGWTGADRVIAGVPGLVAAGSARWEAGPGGWSLEVAGRGLVPTADPSPAEKLSGTSSAVERREWAGALVSLRGAVPLGAGFLLSLALDNALDLRTRSYGGSANDPGVDLRAALSHAW